MRERETERERERERERDRERERQRERETKECLNCTCNIPRRANKIRFNQKDNIIFVTVSTLAKNAALMRKQATNSWNLKGQSDMFHLDKPDRFLDHFTKLHFNPVLVRSPTPAPDLIS